MIRAGGWIAGPQVCPIFVLRRELFKAQRERYMTKGVQAIKERLTQNPLFYVGSEIRCKTCGGKGKRVPLYAVTNYNIFHTCAGCKRSARYPPFLV